jgi:2-amino-4-hydroxy-6-hydroxymethyldihydropteridine diphosphokinase
MENSVYLLLGSNLGDRLQVLGLSVHMIREKVGEVCILSSIYETAPWGILDQPSFLNQVIEVRTILEAEEVLRIILEIEHELGRVRYERWGARVIDIDLLYFQDRVMDSARLTLPHPKLHERRFTLIPLTEIAPDFVHPVFMKNSVQLLAACTDTSDVNLYA